MVGGLPGWGGGFLRQRLTRSRAGGATCLRGCRGGWGGEEEEVEEMEEELCTTLQAK